jgi:hypothetical protein
LWGKATQRGTGQGMAGNSSKSKATAELAQLGLRPRLVGDELAAAYVGLSTGAFRKAVNEEGRYPAAIQDGRRRQWDLRALDACLDRRSGLTPSSNETADEVMRAIDAA